MNDETRRAIALFRFGVLGPLVSARLDHGDRVAYFVAAAARDYVLPDGRVARFSPRTIETWFHAHRARGLSGLMPASRSDAGQSRALAPEVRDLILRAKREKPRRSIRRIIAMLERAKVVAPRVLAPSTVHRLLAREGISWRPSRADFDAETGTVLGPVIERRSFLAEHVGDLWIGDGLELRQRVAFPDGAVCKAHLLSQIDCASRYVAHSYLAKHEDACDQERGFQQAILKYGVPRAYYVDRGPAYVAGSLRAICAELSCRLLHAGPRDAAAKGAIERWHRRWREEVEDELPRGAVVPYDVVAGAHVAWLAREYHLRVHETVGQAPRERFLAEVSELRPAPAPAALTEIFLHRAVRTVRNDGTVRWNGGYLEVRPELSGKVELRFEPRGDALPKVYRDGAFVCDTVPLDRVANMHRPRRRIAAAPAAGVEPTGIDPLAQFVEEHARASRLRYLADDDDDRDDEED